MTNPPEKLKLVAEDAAGMPVIHHATNAITERSNGETEWSGVVETFTSAHGFVYAWVIDSDDPPQYVAVVGKPPILSPAAAVRAWLAAQARL